MKNQRGITLIALVITIIVLLILAGVTISMVVGDNGILTRADNASENTRGGKVEEAKTLWQNEKKLATYDEDPNIKVETQDELLERLVKEGSLTEKEKKEIEETGQVTIGNKTIVFEKVIWKCTHDDIDYIDNNNGTHKGICANCLEEVVINENHVEGYAVDECAKCGAKI